MDTKPEQIIDDSDAMRRLAGYGDAMDLSEAGDLNTSLDSILEERFGSPDICKNITWKEL